MRFSVLAFLLFVSCTDPGRKVQYGYYSDVSRPVRVTGAEGMLLCKSVETSSNGTILHDCRDDKHGWEAWLGKRIHCNDGVCWSELN